MANKICAFCGKPLGLFGRENLVCGGAMLRRGRQTFKLGEETLFFSDLNRLDSGSLELELLACEKCGKVEFYLPRDGKDRA